MVCSKMNFAAGDKIYGSTGANSSSGEGVLELSGCGVEGLGEKCKVTSFTSTKLKEHLVYLSAERTGKLGLEFSPVTGESFATINLSGSPCLYEQIRLRGTLGADVNMNGKTIEVGKEPAEGKALTLWLPAVPIKSAWTEKSGSLVKEKEIRLEMNGGLELSEEGGFSLELAGGTEWGVFTK